MSTAKHYCLTVSAMTPALCLSKMANGVTFDHIMRQLYRLWLRESDEGQRSYPQIFLTGAEQTSFWKPKSKSGVSHDRGSSVGTRHALRLAKGRAQPYFSGSQGADRNRFSRWLTDEAQAGRIHPPVRRPGDPTSVPSRHILVNAPGHLKKSCARGVNLVGYLSRTRRRTGCAFTRQHIGGAGIPFSTVVNTDTQSRQEIRFAMTPPASAIRYQRRCGEC